MSSASSGVALRRRPDRASEVASDAFDLPIAVAGRVETATAILGASDALSDRARVELDRARVLELLGESLEPALAEAVRLLRAKRNVRAIRAVDSAGASALT